MGHGHGSIVVGGDPLHFCAMGLSDIDAEVLKRGTDRRESDLLTSPYFLCLTSSLFCEAGTSQTFLKYLSSLQLPRISRLRAYMCDHGYLHMRH